MLKFCPYCQQEKEESEFKNWKRRCKECLRSFYKERNLERSKDEEYQKKHREQAKAYYHANKEKVREQRFLANYGITQDEYNFLLDLQNGVCAICQNPETAKDHGKQNRKALAVDHCHVTKKVRGLLCQACNTGIGSLKDSPEILSKAIDYLRG